MTDRTDVLVVGAGPVGLVTALQARAHGATVRVVERRTQAFRPSRAMILHPRTLESLRPLGVTDTILSRGDTTPSAELHLGRRTLSVRLAELDIPDTAFPHLTMVRQMDVEEVLLDALREAGGEVDWGSDLVDFTEHDDHVSCAVLGSTRTEPVEARYVAGCDGAASTIRELAGIGWRGGAYREEIVLADLEVEGLAPGRLHVVVAKEGLLFLFALGELGSWRLLATRPRGAAEQPFGQTGEGVPDSVVRDLVGGAGLGVVAAVQWSSVVRLQHRLADAFSAGRLFLAGDAAHAHSPAAAQGMNTGILDAVNLGWKLAFAARRPGPHVDALLGSYEQERRPVARQVLALTHLVFFAEASTNPLPAFLRGTVLPFVAPVMPMVLRRRWLLAQVVRLLSQRWVRHRRSPLSVDASPDLTDWPRPGDRLPDRQVVSEGEVRRLHDLTSTPGVHVLLERDAVVSEREPLGDDATVHRLTDHPGDGLVAVRPDGYVGLRCRAAEVRRLHAWLDLSSAR